MGAPFLYLDSGGGLDYASGLFYYAFGLFYYASGFFVLISPWRGFFCSASPTELSGAMGTLWEMIGIMGSADRWREMKIKKAQYLQDQSSTFTGESARIESGVIRQSTARIFTPASAARRRALPKSGCMVSLGRKQQISFIWITKNT